MQAQITKLAAVATMAMGLALTATPAGATTVTLPAWEGLDGAGGGGNARAAVVRLNAGQDGEQEPGYMVGRHFVGFQLPE